MRKCLKDNLKLSDQPMIETYNKTINLILYLSLFSFYIIGQTLVGTDMTPTSQCFTSYKLSKGLTFLFCNIFNLTSRTIIKYRGTTYTI